eukprot:142205_1
MSNSNHQSTCYIITKDGQSNIFDAINSRKWCNIKIHYSLTKSSVAYSMKYLTIIEIVCHHYYKKLNLKNKTLSIQSLTTNTKIQMQIVNILSYKAIYVLSILLFFVCALLNGVLIIHTDIILKKYLISFVISTFMKYIKKLCIFTRKQLGKFVKFSKGQHHTLTRRNLNQKSICTFFI